MPLPFPEEYNSLKIPQCFGHVEMVDLFRWFLSRLIPFILYRAGTVEGGGKGVEYFSFASDENFFHAGERNSFTPRKTRFSTAGEKNRQLFFIEERINYLFILFSKKQSFVTELLMNN